MAGATEAVGLLLLRDDAADATARGLRAAGAAEARGHSECASMVRQWMDSRAEAAMRSLLEEEEEGQHEGDETRQAPHEPSQRYERRARAAKASEAGRQVTAAAATASATAPAAVDETRFATAPLAAALMPSALARSVALRGAASDSTAPNTGGGSAAQALAERSRRRAAAAAAADGTDPNANAIP